MIRSRPLIGHPPPFFKKILYKIKKQQLQPLQDCIGPTIRIRREILCLPYAGFSPNRPTGPIRSSSCKVCLCVCVFVCPHPMRFFLSVEIKMVLMWNVAIH